MALEKEELTISGKVTIDSALQLIRYDIPCLILGKSSIGKSYTLIKICERWHIPHQLLYIGSEKAENIEGIPKLTDRGKTKEGDDKEIMEYLQPFWFPNPQVITESVKNGRSLFERFVASAWDVKSLKKFTPTYMNLHSILNGLENLQFDISMINKSSNKYIMEATLIDTNWIQATGNGAVSSERVLNPNKLFTLEKDATFIDANDKSYYRDDLRDFCAYMRTVLGYGNYWLILDEIDKVEDHDKDKFAPLLHIVRERTLKNFSMIDINEGKGLGIPLGKSFQEGGYKSIINDVNTLLDSGESVLDTRVMAVANKTFNIEEALFRRFCQLIADDILIWREQDISKEETLITQCLGKIKDEMIEAGEEGGSLRVGDDLRQYISEVNLQWEYNFLPKMVNNIDTQGNYFNLNSREEYDRSNEFGFNWDMTKQTTAFYNLLENNFNAEKYNIGKNLYNCLESQILDLDTADSVGVSKKEDAVDAYKKIYIQKIEELGGDMELAAIDIGNSVRESYPERTAETDKLNLMTLWTDGVIRRLQAVIYSDEINVQPMDFAKFLVPELVGAFYTKLAQDKDYNSDNIQTQIEMFQSFWKKVANDSPKFSMQCDTGMTQNNFYGNDKDNTPAKDTLYGRGSDESKNGWNNSASGLLSKEEVLNSIGANVIQAMVATKGYVRTSEVFTEDYDGAGTWLQENINDELQNKRDLDLQSSQNAKTKGNIRLRKQFADSASVLNQIIGE